MDGLITAIFGFIGAIIGGAVTYWTIERDRKKRAEVEFLRRCYLKIAKSSSRPYDKNKYYLENEGRYKEFFEDAIDEIQLFGDKALAETARETTVAAGDISESNRLHEKLMDMLRDRLRNELGKEEFKARPRVFRHQSSESDKNTHS